MAVRYFNGFELNYSIGPLSGAASGNVSGYWDFNTYFAHSTFDFAYPIYTRTDGTQALTIGTQSGAFGTAALNALNFPSPTDVGRIGFEFRYGTLPVTERSLFYIGRIGRYVHFSIDSTGTVRAYNTTSLTYDGWSSGTLIGVVGVATAGTFERLEIRHRQTTGEVDVWWNGTQTIDATITTASSSFVDFGWPTPPVFGTGVPLQIDNIWVTDGEALVEGLNAVTIEAAIDNYEAGAGTATLTGFMGSLVFEDSQYQSAGLGSNLSSLDASASVLGKNVTNIRNYLFTTNPHTGLAWDDSDLGTFKWGVCYYTLGDLDTIRLAGLALSTLSLIDGVPTVTYYKPGNLTYFSGPWVKKDTSLTYGANVRGLPRRNILLEADAPALFINGPGCILFDSLDQDDDDPFSNIGITFAEEFRTDYRDWVRVTGSGYSFDSYFIAGYGIYGEGNRQFQNNYVTVNYRNVPTGGAYIQGLWDYTFDPDNGRWSMRQQVYHNSEGQTHGMRKLKIRGHGKALQIRVISDGDKPFDINGWSLLITSNTAV